jgi:hypothetical protein
MEHRAMRIRITLIVTAILLLSLPSQPWARDDVSWPVDAKMVARMKPEWLACQQSNDCVVIEYSCSGRVAVNSRYKDTASEIVYQFGSSSWAGCDTAVGDGVAVCEHGACAVARLMP